MIKKVCPRFIIKKLAKIFHSSWTTEALRSFLQMPTLLKTREKRRKSVSMKKCSEDKLKMKPKNLEDESKRKKTNSRRLRTKIQRRLLKKKNHRESFRRNLKSQPPVKKDRELMRKMKKQILRPHQNLKMIKIF